MRVFIDTNVWASGLAGSGLCSDLLDYVQQRHEPVLCPQVMAELRRALPKIGLEPFAVQACCFVVADAATSVPDAKAAPRRSRDPKDDALLQAALDGGCEWFVTGDKDLLVLKRVDGMPLTTPRDFLEALGVEEPWD